MIKLINSALVLMMLIGCQSQNRQTEDTNQVVDTTSAMNITSAKSNFDTIMGFDSVAKADYVFVDYNIDSITISRLTFEAIYLYCFKGSIHKENYHALEKSDPDEYKEIINLHTSHLLSIQGKEFSFNAKGAIGCWKNIPESTMVEVNSKVYSLFSGRKSIGKIIILESIRKKTLSQIRRLGENGG